MKNIMAKIVLLANVIIGIVVSNCGRHNTDKNCFNVFSYDSLEAYYSAEDVVAYAYLNSDLGIDLNQCEDIELYDFNKNIIDKTDLFKEYDWYVFVPKYICEKCVIDLCEIFNEQGLMGRVAFIFPKDESFDSLIREAGIAFEDIKYLKGRIGIPAESENLMFVFTISQNSIINNVYIPDRELKNLTEVYINIVKLKNTGQYNIRNVNIN